MIYRWMFVLTGNPAWPLVPGIPGGPTRPTFPRRPRLPRAPGGPGYGGDVVGWDHNDCDDIDQLVMMLGNHIIIFLL